MRSHNADMRMRPNAEVTQAYFISFPKKYVAIKLGIHTSSS